MLNDNLFLTVDFGGIVMFDAACLKGCFGRDIAEGENLYRLFVTTDMGDEVVDAGAVIPIVGINDSTYEILIRSDAEKSSVDDLIIVSNGVFPLEVRQRLVIADLAVLYEWDEGLGWHSLRVDPGFYGVTVNGFRKIEAGAVSRFGYELVFARHDSLPAFSGDLEREMQVLQLNQDG